MATPPPPLAGWPCLSRHGEALWLAVSVSPNAKRTMADGLHDGALRVRLAAPPVDGKANDTLVAWLAAELGVPRRAVSLVRGPAARRKSLAIDAPAEVLQAWLSGLGLQLLASDAVSPGPHMNSSRPHRRASE